MSKLISHKIQISAIYCRQRKQAYHFVQGYTAVYIAISIIAMEVPIHISVYKAENNGFIVTKTAMIKYNVH